jgi:FtsP/CotA-like multicopper oxidase with cupredoxin domain
MIEVNEGDRVRIIHHNKLPEPTSIHWHGLEVPPEMDGVPFISQPMIEPGATFTYEFTLNQNGTFFYHSHGAMQEMMGMIGLFVIHPKTPNTPYCHRDFGLILQEWALLPNNPVPNSMAMEFNWLTINGKAGPATTPMLVRQGERVRWSTSVWTITPCTFTVTSSTSPAPKEDEYPKPRGIRAIRCSSVLLRRATSSLMQFTSATGCFIVTCRIT